jgi:hypothetical protein
MKGPPRRTTELRWTDPREGRSWLVRTYWTGDAGLGALGGFEARESLERSQARIIFLFPADLESVEEAHTTRNPRERTAGELSERELMELLDQARREKR